MDRSPTAALSLVASHMDMIESFAISAKEAARRHDRAELEMRMKQIRKELMDAIAAFKTIDDTLET
jgi:hypothetical protein